MKNDRLYLHNPLNYKDIDQIKSYFKYLDFIKVIDLDEDQIKERANAPNLLFDKVITKSNESAFIGTIYERTFYYDRKKTSLLTNEFLFGDKSLETCMKTGIDELPLFFGY